MTRHTGRLLEHGFTFAFPSWDDLCGRKTNLNDGSSAAAASSSALRRMWLYVRIIAGETWPICA
jgi:hypothetical protein